MNEKIVGIKLLQSGLLRKLAVRWMDGRTKRDAEVVIPKEGLMETAESLHRLADFLEFEHRKARKG